MSYILIMQNPTTYLNMQTLQLGNLLSHTIRFRLVCHVKVYRPSHRIFGQMHRVLNIDYL